MSEHDYNKKVLTIKDLEFIWDAIKAEKTGTAAIGVATAAAPVVDGKKASEEQLEDFDQTNTVLIDDSFDKVQLQPHNGVQLLDFDEDLARAGTDCELLKVRRYLEKLIYQKNVSAYMRVHPFNSNAPLHEGNTCFCLTPYFFVSRLSSLINLSHFSLTLINYINLL